MVSVLPDWPYRMNDIARSEPSRTCCFRLPRLATTKLDALGQDRGASGTMDRSVHATPTP